MRRIPREHHVLRAFMALTERARVLYGPASHGDVRAPVVHRHDAFEEASERELATFEIESDSSGHRYAVRRERH